MRRDENTPRCVFTSNFDPLAIQKDYQSIFQLQIFDENHNFHLNPFLETSLHTFSQRKKRKVMKMSDFTSLYKTRGLNFKFWPKFSRKFCSECGSPHHNVRTCIHRTSSRTDLKLKSKPDTFMYDFLAQWEPLPKIQIDKNRHDLGSFLLENFYSTLLSREKDFWRQFKNFSGSDLREFTSYTFHLNRQSIGFWAAFGVNSETLIDIYFGSKIRWTQEVPKFEIKQQKNTQFQEELLKSVEKDAKQGKIWRIPEKFARNIIPVFMVEQITPEGQVKYRRILNCVPLNFYVPDQPFELPTPEIAVQASNQFLITIDLSGAYFQKGLATTDIPYFCFKIFDGKKWRFYCHNSIPFGLSIAPFLFQRFFSIVEKFFEKFGLSLLYLDDLILGIPVSIESNDEEIRAYIKFILKLFASLGLKINSKTDLTPSKEILWLGKNVNSHVNEVFPPLEKIKRHLSSFHLLLRRGTVTLTELASLRGKLQFLTSNSFRYIFRKIDFFFKKHLSPQEFSDLINKSNSQLKKKYKVPLKFPISFWESFFEIQDLVLNMLSPLPSSLPQHQIFLFSDASELAGGFFWSSNDYISKKFQISKNSLSQIKMPARYQVEKNIPQKFHPSSILREAFVLEKAVSKFVVFFNNKQEIYNGHIHLQLHCDNLGLICNLKSQKASFLELQSILDSILSKLNSVKQLTFSFEWTRRSISQAEIADDLSKTYTLRLSQKGHDMLFKWANARNKRIQTPFFTPWSIFETLFLQTWSPRKHKQKDKTSLILIHPCTQKKQLLRIRELLINLQFKGVVGFKYSRLTDKIFNFEKRLSLGFLKCSKKFFKSQEKFYNSRQSYKFFFMF